MALIQGFVGPGKDRSATCSYTGQEAHVFEFFEVPTILSRTKLFRKPRYVVASRDLVTCINCLDQLLLPFIQIRFDILPGKRARCSGAMHLFFAMHLVFAFD